MIIRDGLLKQMRESVRHNFIRGAAAHLRRRFPKETAEAGSGILEKRIDRQITRAAQYGVTLSDDVRRFLECCVRFGWNFDVAPDMAWAARILQTTGVDGSTKMDRIENYELFVLKARVGVAHE